MTEIMTTTTTRRSNVPRKQKKKNTPRHIPFDAIACSLKSFNMEIVLCFFFFWFLINCVGEFVTNIVPQPLRLSSIQCETGRPKPWEQTFLFLLRARAREKQIPNMHTVRLLQIWFTFVFDGLTCGHVCGRRSHICYVFFLQLRPLHRVMMSS